MYSVWSHNSKVNMWNKKHLSLLFPHFFPNSSCMELKYISTITFPITWQTYKAFSKLFIPITYKASRQDSKHLDFQGMTSSLSHIIWKSAFCKTTVPCPLIKYFENWITTYRSNPKRHLNICSILHLLFYHFHMQMANAHSPTEFSILVLLFATQTCRRRASS